MYCTSCGKELNGVNFCIYCGKQVPSNEGPAAPLQVNNYRAKTTVQTSSKKGTFLIIGIVSVFCVVLVVLAFGNQEKTPPTSGKPYGNQPYSYDTGSDYYSAQNQFPAAGNFSYPYPDYSNDDTYDSYDYGSSTQTCTSCYGSGSCDFCHGTGQYSMYGNDLSDCTACYGSGDCSICGGDGVY